MVDRRDPLIRSFGELRGLLGLSVLGQVPRDRQPRDAADFARICHDLPRSSYAEAFRAIRTDVDLLRRRLGFQVLLISSAYQGDGKSCVASNLAISLAHAGRRVLLIDADLRRPRQHTLHPAEEGVGLVQVLRDAPPIARAARRTDIATLDLIVAGPEIQTPPSCSPRPAWPRPARPTTWSSSTRPRCWPSPTRRSWARWPTA